MDYNYSYNNNNGGTFQGGPGQYPLNPQNQLYLKARGERKAIKTIGSVAGLCVISYVVLQNVLALPIGLIPYFSNLYRNSDEFFYLYILLSSVFTMMIPFVIGGMYLRKRTGTEIFCFDAPKNAEIAVPAVPMGLLICLIGNLLTVLFVASMEKIGFSLTSPDLNTPQSLTGRLPKSFQSEDALCNRSAGTVIPSRLLPRHCCSQFFTATSCRRRLHFSPVSGSDTSAA